MGVKISEPMAIKRLFCLCHSQEINTSNNNVHNRKEVLGKIGQIFQCAVPFTDHFEYGP